MTDQTYSFEHLTALKDMVQRKTGLPYSIRVLVTNPDIVELTEHCDIRAWMDGPAFIAIQAGAEDVMGQPMMLRELSGKHRVLQLTPRTEDQKWPTTS